jgi:hypothetical protein
MKPPRLILTVYLSTLFLGSVVAAAGLQQPAPKPASKTGSGGPSSKRQAPALAAPSEEKKITKEPAQSAEEESGELKAGNKPNLAELRQRGIELAQHVGEETNDLDERRSAAIIQASAADILWQFRNEPARELFRKAFEIADAHYQETLDDNQRRLNKQSWTSRKDVRVEVIKLINKRDPKMGAAYNQKYIESKSREEQERAARAASGQSPRLAENKYFGSNVAASAGLIDAANSLIKNDARAALEIARGAAEMAISPGFVRFLSTLADRDRAAADELFLHALRKLNAAQAPIPGQWLALSAYTFGEDQIRVRDGSSSSGYGLKKPDQFVFNPQHARLFLSGAFNALQRLGDPSVLQAPDGSSRLSVGLYAAKILEPKVAAFHAGLKDQWQSMTRSLAALSADGAAQNIQQAIERDAERGTKRQAGEPLQPSDSRLKDPVEHLLENAQKTKDFALRDGYYVQAAQAAESAGDPSQALDIVGKISDLNLRMITKSWINYNAAEKALNEKRVEDARRYALDVDALDHRAYLFFKIAEHLFRSNELDRSRELLEQAASGAIEAEDTQEKVKALCSIADFYLKIDQDRSFSLADATVRTVNRIPADKMDLIEGASQMVRTLSYSGGAQTSTSEVGEFDLRKVFGRLAAADFDRSLALAQGIENKSLRCWTMLAVAESALAKR